MFFLLAVSNIVSLYNLGVKFFSSVILETFIRFFFGILNMIVKLFGLIDLFAALIFILVQWDIGIRWGVIMAIFLIVKSIIFIADIASIIDLIAGIYLVIVLLGWHSAFSVIFISSFIVVILSIKGGVPDITKAFQAGADDYIIKPPIPEFITKKIKLYLGIR